MEWIEVVDSAVKIGLGAAITGVTAFFISKGNRQHEFDKEYFKRRQDLLERVSENFEEIHMLFFKITIDYSGYVESYVKDLFPSQDHRDKYYSYIQQIGDRLRELHLLEGRLLLAGISEGTDCLREYRLLATDVNNIIRLDEPEATRAEVLRKTGELCSKKDQFYSTLSEAYKSM